MKADTIDKIVGVLHTYKRGRMTAGQAIAEIKTSWLTDILILRYRASLPRNPER